MKKAVVLLALLLCGLNAAAGSFIVEPAREPGIVGVAERSAPCEAEADTDTGSFEARIDRQRCTFDGIPLEGSVRVVTAFGDFRIQVVDAFEDIRVQVVDVSPHGCGRWQFVDSFPDFTIEYVTVFPDVRVKFVTAFPGMD